MNVYSPYLSGFNKNHGCQNMQNVLLRFIEKCIWSLDSNSVFGAIFTDLSKVFDCLPHRLLVSKLSAYGLHWSARLLMGDYFTHRNQRVKMGVTRSEWSQVNKGMQQGSILGPHVFNIFQNDLMYLLNSPCDLYTQTTIP